MRIIAGTARSRRLVAPDSIGTRPVTDRVREAVFSSIGDWVESAAVLDLYAGSGSFGLEALSRGAARATFVEIGHKALGALRKNVETVGLGGTVVSSSVEDFLKRSDGSFDIVFMDPPWPLGRDEIETALAGVDPLVNAQAEIIISRRHSDEIPTPPESWRVATNRRYGDTRILRYEKEGQDQ